VQNCFMGVIFNSVLYVKLKIIFFSFQDLSLFTKHPQRRPTPFSKCRVLQAPIGVKVSLLSGKHLIHTENNSDRAETSLRFKVPIIDDMGRVNLYLIILIMFGEE
jgi:hypothetical protein